MDKKKGFEPEQNIYRNREKKNVLNEEHWKEQGEQTESQD